MNAIPLTLLALIVCAASSFGGEIYGTIKEEGGTSVAKGAKLEIKSAAQVYPAVTDEFGNYRVVVAETGKCTVTVEFKTGHTVSSEIQSYTTPVRFDWVLAKNGDGTYSLRRQ